MRTSRSFQVSVVAILLISAVALYELDRRATDETHANLPIAPLPATPITPPRAAQARPTPATREARSAARLTAPCTAQITLRIGTVDPEFKLERATLEAALLDAAHEWNSATGREWFVVSASDGVAINLLFDGRQAELDERATAEEELNEEVETLAKESSERDREYQDVERLIASFNQRKAHYEELVTAHNSAVTQAQQTGSPSEETVIALRNEERRLGELRRELDESSRHIKQVIDEFNLRLRALEPSREALNDKIKSFKERFPPLLIREAEHRKGAFVNEVNVYAFTNAQDLHFTLLHELGHTLGLSHASQTGAVMSPIREPGSSVYHLTDWDIDAALKLCEERS